MDDVEFWWVVSELTDFTPSVPMPFPVEVKRPEHCLGYFAVFSNYSAAVDFANGKHSIVKCLQVTRPAGKE